MAFFMHDAGGSLGAASPWSIGMNTSGSISEAAAETVWGNAITAFFATAAVAALYSTTTTLTATSTSTASPTWRQTTKTRTTHAGAGTAVTQELPVHDCMLITTRTAAASKSGHGRMYFPAPVAAALSIGSGGHISTGSTTTLVTALGVLKAALSTGGLTPILLTRRATSSGLPAFTTQAITSWELVHTIAVQNRRGDKVVPIRTSF